MNCLQWFRMGSSLQGYYFDRDDKSLPNFAKFFHEQSKEERRKWEKMMSLQNQRGGGYICRNKVLDSDCAGSKCQINGVNERCVCVCVCASGVSVCVCVCPCCVYVCMCVCVVCVCVWCVRVCGVGSVCGVCV